MPSQRWINRTISGFSPSLEFILKIKWNKRKFCHQFIGFEVLYTTYVVFYHRYIDAIVCALRWCGIPRMKSRRNFFLRLHFRGTQIQRNVSPTQIQVTHINGLLLFSWERRYRSTWVDSKNRTIWIVELLISSFEKFLIVCNSNYSWWWSNIWIANKTIQSTKYSIHSHATACSTHTLKYTFHVAELMCVVWCGVNITL